METKENVFRQALKGKKIPILTLDNKWYQLFTRENNDPKMEQLAEELKALVAKQGQINSDLKDIRKLKADG